MKTATEKTRKQTQIEEMMKFAKTLTDEGFVIIVPKKHPFEWMHFYKDGSFGYVNPAYFGGFDFSTVHKPCKECGTGFATGRGVELTITEAKKTLKLAPEWASVKDRKAIQRYSSIEEFMNSRNNTWSEQFIFSSPKFIREWDDLQFDAMQLVIENHFKNKTLHTNYGENQLSVLDTFDSIAGILGLAYTSSSSYAGYWICNVSLYLNDNPQWQYSGFAISEDLKFYAIIQDIDENEFILLL